MCKCVQCSPEEGGARLEPFRTVSFGDRRVLSFVNIPMKVISFFRISRPHPPSDELMDLLISNSHICFRKRMFCDPCSVFLFVCVCMFFLSSSNVMLRFGHFLPYVCCCLCWKGTPSITDLSAKPVGGVIMSSAFLSSFSVQIHSNYLFQVTVVFPLWNSAFSWFFPVLLVVKDNLALHSRSQLISLLNMYNILWVRGIVCFSYLSSVNKPNMVSL